MRSNERHCEIFMIRISINLVLRIKFLVYIILFFIPYQGDIGVQKATEIRGRCKGCCLPMAELVYLTLFTVCFLGLRIPNLHARHPSTVSCLVAGHVCCIRNIPQYRLTPAEYRQPKAPFILPAPSSSTQTPFLSREKSAVLGFRTGDISDQSQVL
jgi:hypothetical protein